MKRRQLYNLAVVVMFLFLLVGLPLLLLQLGSPFPSSWPGADVIAETFDGNRPLSDRFIINVLAIGIWILWAQLVYVTLVETYSTLKGKLASPTFTMPGLQLLAAKAVTTLAILLASLWAKPAMATPLVDTTLSTQVVEDFSTVQRVNSSEVVEGRGTLDSPVDNSTDKQAPTSSTSQTYEVKPGDSWWSVAETELGDGTRWKEVRTANLNKRMPDAQIITTGTEFLDTGWLLEIPDAKASAKAAQPANNQDQSTETETVVVEQGDTVWELVEDNFDDALDNTEIAEGVADVANINSLSDPNLIHPGDTLEVPTRSQLAQHQQNVSAGSVSATEPDELQTNVNLGSISEAAGGPSNESLQALHPIEEHGLSEIDNTNDTGENGDSDGFVKELALLIVGLGTGGALVSSKLLSKLKNWRRYKLAHRELGTKPEPVAQPLELMELALHEQANNVEQQWIEQALSTLSTVESSVSFGQPKIAHVDDVGIGLTFESLPTDATSELWQQIEPNKLHLKRSADLAAAADVESAATLPTFVTVAEGTLVNLESMGLINIVGSAEQRLFIAQSIVHELATGLSSGIVDIRTNLKLQGVDAYPLVSESSVEAIGQEVALWAAQIQDKFKAESIPDAYCQRLSQPDEAIAPIVVVVEGDLNESLSQLFEIAAQRTLPLGIVWLTDEPTETVTPNKIVCSQKSAMLLPEGIVIEPQSFDSSAAAKYGELYRHATSAESQILSESVYSDVKKVSLAAVSTKSDWPSTTKAYVGRHLTEVEELGEIWKEGFTYVPSAERGVAEVTSSEVNIASVSEVPEDGVLRVSLLGLIEVSGAKEQLTQQQLSLVSYLACHGATSKEVLINALWDGQLISKSRFPNMLTEIRARIGREHLPEAINSKYSLADYESDLANFEKASKLAKTQSNTEAIETLTSAVALIKGKPLTTPGKRYWSWVGDQANLSANIECLMADTCHWLSTLLVESGDLEKAKWACEQGLLAASLDENLVVLLTEVYLAQGKPKAARRLVDNWEDQINRLECGEPSDEPRKRLVG